MSDRWDKEIDKLKMVKLTTNPQSRCHHGTMGRIHVEKNVVKLSKKIEKQEKIDEKHRTCGSRNSDQETDNNISC